MVKRALSYAKRRALSFLGIDAVTGLRFRKEGVLTLGSKRASWAIPISPALPPGAVCYCVGCGEDISFDIALISKGLEVWGFDPTPRAIAHVQRAAPKEYRFRSIGLWDEDTELKLFAPANPEHVSHSALNLQHTNDYFIAPVRRLASLMRELGHAHIGLLKLDIEGAEYRVVESLISDNISVAVICIEYDETFHPSPGYQKRIRDSLLALKTAGFEIVHTPGNGNYTLVHCESSMALAQKDPRVGAAA